MTDDFASPARLRLAHAVRHLIDASLTAEDVTDAELDAAAVAAERLAQDLHGAEPGSAPAGVRTRDEIEPGAYLARSPLVGHANPVSPPIEHEFVDGRLLARGRFHAAYEGPPGYVHGGWIALAFDEVLGMANAGSGHPGMTGRLMVRYRRPTPLHTELEIEAWTDQVDGRRIVTRGVIRAHGEVTAEAEGLFVMIGADKALEYFGKEYAARRRALAADPLP